MQVKSFGLCAILSLAIAGTASAGLRITEVMSSSNGGG